MKMRASVIALGLVTPSVAIPHTTHHGHEHSATDTAMELLAEDFSRGVPLPEAVPFPISAVKLAPESLFGIAQERNREFQLSLDDTQWLCQMTSAANLTACSGKCATPGAVGAPPCTQLPGEMGPGGYYGHYQGHYLSGTAMMWNNTGDAAIKAKADKLIAEMAKAQDAWSGKVDFYGVPSDGYLFVNHPNVFGIMEGRCGMPGPEISYSVPYYSLHKIMAGLLDHWHMAHSEQAFAMVKKMGGWVNKRVEATLKRGGEKLWQCVLNTEWGGMNEVMYNLYDATGDESFLATGKKFNHWQWTAPLAIGDDDIDASHGNTGGNHANTHIPEIIGSARGFEVTGNATQKAIAVNFFNIVTQNHSWATGGSNDGEHWTSPQRMGNQLNADTEESCTQYNILKVARHLFKWTASSTMGDFYERAIMNGIIGNQNKLDPAMTEFIYMLPLGAGGMHKPWGKSNQSFPCCWGTLTEQFSKMSDSIYFASPDHRSIFINQFMSSEITWVEQGVTIKQVAGFPASTTSTTTITVEKAAKATSFALKIRVPAWANGANKVSVAGKAVSGITAGEYLTISQEWKEGDTIEVHFPPALSASLVQDNRTAFNSTMAWMYGPIVLAGVGNASDSIYFDPEGGDGAKPEAFIRRAADATELRFVASGKDMVGGPVAMDMMPLYEIMEESYAVYFKCGGAPALVPYSAAGSMIPTSDPIDFELKNAATQRCLGGQQECPGGHGLAPGQADIRTSGPGVISSVTLVHPIEAKGHKIDSISFTYRYLSGYGAEGPPSSWPVLSAELVSSGTKEVLKELYTSPPLDKYKFDSGMPYSPPVQASSPTGLAVANDELAYVRFTIKNNQRNVQIPLDPKLGLNVTVHWAKPEGGFTHAQFGTGEEL